jgi:hypothetical protein
MRAATSIILRGGPFDGKEVPWQGPGDDERRYPYRMQIAGCWANVDLIYLYSRVFPERPVLSFRHIDVDADDLAGVDWSKQTTD